MRVSRLFAAFALLSIAQLDRPVEACVNHVLRQVLEVEAFSQDRGIGMYAHLGPDYVADLARLGPDSHIVDLGAGMANFGTEYLSPERIEGMANYPHVFDHPPAERARYTAISYKMDPKRKSEVLGCAPGRTDVVAEGLFEQVPHERLTSRFGKADLLQDFFGAMSYTADPASVLKKSLEITKEEGVLYFYLGKDNERIVTPAGEMRLLDWFKTIEGIDVKVHGGALSVRRILGSKIKIPKLELSKDPDPLSGPPPFREFHLTGEYLAF